MTRTRRYAEDTKVPVQKSLADIETLVSRHGGDQFMSGWTEGHAQVAFRVEGRLLRFRIPLPKPDSQGFEQERRRIWRSLLLCIKSKFEVVASGIEEFDEAFLANIVMSDGATFGEWAAPQIESMYQSGKMPPLLPGPTS